jgi:hypothetical protein
MGLSLRIVSGPSGDGLLQCALALGNGSLSLGIYVGTGMHLTYVGINVKASKA